MNASLKETVRAIMEANALSEFTALRYLQQMGQNPERDEMGKVIVRDELRRELARVTMPPVGGTPALSDFPDSRPRPLRVDAHIVLRDGHLFPVMNHNGRCYAIEAKPSLLDLGIAAMRPLKSDFSDDYKAPVDFHAWLPADPENGRLQASHLEHFTDHRTIVALARRFYVLTAIEEAAEGPLSITKADLES